MDPVLIGFIAYLVLILAVGLVTYKLNRTGEDYLLAGRRLPTWVATFSERASGESAWLLLGLPWAVYTVGLVEIWTVIGCVGGIGFSWWFVAGPLRRETERLGALTIPQYFVARFGMQGHLVRLTATAIVIFFFALYLAANLDGAGKILKVTFDIPHFWGMVIGAVVVVLYTVLGGFFAVAWTDLVQGIIMLCTLVILPLVAWAEIAHQGLDVQAALTAAGPEINSLIGGKTGWPAIAAVIGGLSWGLGYMGQPHVIIRYMSIKSVDSVKQARVIAISWAALAFTGAFLIGLFGLVLQANTEMVKEGLMPLMATTYLPLWLSGIFISGAVAAMMSTADSQLLVATSAVSEDVVHRIFKPGLDHRSMVRISRITALVVGVLAFAFAIYTDELIYGLVSYAWAGLGASFGPAIFLSLYWKKTTGQGVVAGMITGCATTIIWSEVPGLNDFITVRLASFALATMAVWSVSLATWTLREE